MPGFQDRVDVIQWVTNWKAEGKERGGETAGFWFRQQGGPRETKRVGAGSTFCSHHHPPPHTESHLRSPARVRARLVPTPSQGGPSLVVQWLGLHTPNAGGLGSIPGQGTRPHMPQLNVHILN